MTDRVAAFDPTDVYLDLRGDGRATMHPGGPAFWAGLMGGDVALDGRLVSCADTDGAWDSWEMHPHGDEVIVALSGAVTLTLEEPDGLREVIVGPSQMVVVPAGVWHTARSLEPARLLFITAGEGTQHRPVTSS